MDIATVWFIIIGAVLIFAVLTRSFAQRLSLSTTMLYLGVGAVLGPYGYQLIDVAMVNGAPYLERLSEVVVIVSLFTTGLKLSPPIDDRRWGIALRLAFGSMTLTVALIAVLGWLIFDLPPGAAVLLGAILAPTDPVLASDVQLTTPGDQDRLRFSISSEAGLNDGTAFPFVLLGLGLLGLHELGTLGWQWLAFDVLWAITGGLTIGALLGWLIGRIVVYLRARHKEAVGLDEFLALGLISLSYGLALLAGTYGFLAVFAAGLALRRYERRYVGDSAPPAIQLLSADSDSGAIATDPKVAPSYMTQAVLAFNERAEHIGEFFVVLLVGAMLSVSSVTLPLLGFIPLLFLLIRPLSVWLGLLGSPTTCSQRMLTAWFGIRGLGSIYYLCHAIGYGLPHELAEQLSAIVLITVAASVVIHGISVQPLLQRYRRSR